MPEAVGLIENTSLWWREVNIAGPMKLLEVENTALGDFTIAGLPGLTPTYNFDAEGRVVKLFDTKAAPTDNSTADILYRVKLNKRHPLYNLLIDQQKEIYLQRLWYSCPPVNDRVLWKHLEHYRIRASGGTKAASRDLVGAGGSQNNTINMIVSEDVEVFKTSLSRITFAGTLALLALAGVSKDSDCAPGYLGADRILFAGEAANAAPAEVWYSTNGGGTWAQFATDPTPFGVNSNISAVITDFIDEDSIRVIWGRVGDAVTKAQIAYADVPHNATTIDVAAHTIITIAATANNDAIEALFGYKPAGRIYIAAAGDIYVSEDNGATDPGAAIFTGANALAAFAEHNGDIWAAGASNTILREQADNWDTFAARTGPTGGGAFTALAFATDGTLFAGNGTSIFKNSAEAANAGSWVSLRSFGASHAVKKIQCKKGSSICLRVFVDDTTPGPGEVWESEDGGQTWTQISETVQGGYNAIYLPANIDQALIVGDVDTGTGLIELLS